MGTKVSEESLQEFHILIASGRARLGSVIFKSGELLDLTTKLVHSQITGVHSGYRLPNGGRERRRQEWRRVSERKLLQSLLSDRTSGGRKYIVCTASDQSQCANYYH